MDPKQILAVLRSFAGRGIGVPIALIMILAMMVLPLPPLALDVLFTFNITLSLIIILAVVAISGTRRYLASAKTSEARNGVSSIARAAQNAYEREAIAQDFLLENAGNMPVSSHRLCKSATPVPAIVPKGTKYMPNMTDFETGVRYMEFTEAVARSAQGGEAVPLPLD